MMHAAMLAAASALMLRWRPCRSREGRLPRSAVAMLLLSSAARVAPRTSSGYRYHPGSVINRAAFIRQARSAGLTLRQIGEILAVRDGGRPPCAHVANLVDDRLQEVDARIAELRHVRDQLQRLRARLDVLYPAHLLPDTICAAVTRS